MSKFINLVLALVLISLSFVGMSTADDKVTIGETQLVKNTNTTPTAATALSALNHKIVAGKDNKLFLAVYNNRTANGLNVTVKSGTYFQSGLGDLFRVVPALTTMLFGPLESSRFQNATGYIIVETNATAAANGTITSYRLPSS